MTDFTEQPRFLQIHTLTPYVGALLNRDQAGLAKRLTYGGAIRTRVSSQCLKRHWRISDDDHAIKDLAGPDAVRSRHTVQTYVAGNLPDDLTEEQRDFIAGEITAQVYNENAANLKSRQVLLIGWPEIEFMRAQGAELSEILEAGEIAALAASAKAKEKDEETGKAKGTATKKDAALKSGQEKLSGWKKAFKPLWKEMREATAMPAGITGALFGRMVTSDKSACIEAPIQVAHAFTTHEDETESDYFVAVDDINPIGTATIQDSELTSGLYYGYVTVDMPLLLENCGWAHDPEEARRLAAQIVHNLVYLIAEVSPGAKRGSTAPYGRPVMMTIEAGRRQPRSMAEAFRAPLDPSSDTAIRAFCTEMQDCDDLYATGETRMAMHKQAYSVPGSERGSLEALAEFAGRALGAAAEPKLEAA